MNARLGPVLDTLDDDADAPLVILALSRVPFMTHGSVRVVCRRLNTLIASRAFREWRVERGLAEYGLVVAGGYRDGDPIAECSMFISGRWRPITPMSESSSETSIVPTRAMTAFACW